MLTSAYSSEQRVFRPTCRKSGNDYWPKPDWILILATAEADSENPARNRRFGMFGGGDASAH
jgi:hypothetical protein